MKAPLIEQEEMRLALLRGYNILDSAPEESFEEIAELAKSICEVPIALVSLVEDDRQWFKARIGTDLEHTPVDQSICAHAIASESLLEICDTTRDPRTADNPLVTGAPGIRFYAGALIENEQNLPLGTLCVIDTVPRQLTDFQRRALQLLARQTMRQIEFRRALADEEVLRKEVDHRVKNSLQSLAALIRLQARTETAPEAKAALEAVQGRLATISSLHESLYLADAGATVDMAAFLPKVVHSAGQQFPNGVHVTTQVDHAHLSSRAAASVGMIVNEAITNAAKYAYEGRRHGTFSVTGRRDGDYYLLDCIDDGPGVSGIGDPEGTGLGMRIMLAAAQQLGGDMTLPEYDEGLKISVRWPLAHAG
jgi:two-component sensor histidine kinase